MTLDLGNRQYRNISRIIAKIITRTMTDPTERPMIVSVLNVTPGCAFLSSTFFLSVKVVVSVIKNVIFTVIIISIDLIIKRLQAKTNRHFLNTKIREIPF